MCVIFLLMLTLLAACSSPAAPQPQPTAVGTPQGPIASAQIGPAGGTLTSSDNAVKLTVPAGALSSTQTLTLQALSNQAPGALKSYRFGPDDLQFTQPATLELNYTSLTQTPENLALAYQDPQGRWRKPSNTFSQNASSKTLSLPMRHFSDWAFYERWFIAPSQAEVKVNQRRDLEVYFVDCTGKPEDDCLLLPLVGNAKVKAWSVNGAQGGSAEVGMVTGTGSAAYTAPARVPSRNPVNVTALVDAASNGVGQLQVVASLRILEENQNWTGSLKVGFAGRLEATDSHSRDQHQVRFNAQFDIQGPVTESWNDDGTGLVILETKPPTAAFNYSRDYFWNRDGVGGQGVRPQDACSSETRREQTQWQGSPSDNYPETTLSFNVRADRKVVLDYVAPTLLVMRGTQQTTQTCGAVTTPSSQNLGPLTQAFFGRFEVMAGDAVQGNKLSGRSADNHVLEFDSFRIPGTLVVEWNIQRP